VRFKHQATADLLAPFMQHTLATDDHNMAVALSSYLRQVNPNPSPSPSPTLAPSPSPTLILVLHLAQP
jgi:hypothetical protein